MVGPIHTPGALAAFQNGEERMVFARFKNASRDATPYFLVDGTARDKELKAWVPEHLECLMPECLDRRLVVVNRSEHSGRRDGFSHRKGAGRHTPESLFHQQGKALIQSWVRRAYPETEVRREEATQNRARVADVMVTWPDGLQTAFEIQYAPLTVEAWVARHRSYLNQGITPVWLLGHHGTHMKAARAPLEAEWNTDSGQALLSLLHQKMSEHEAMVLWINPVDGTIATPWTVERIKGQPGVHKVSCRPDTERAFLTIDALDDCTLDPEHGLLTPAMRALVQSEEDYQQRLAELEAAAIAAEQARAAELAERAERRRAQAQAWLASDFHARMLAYFEGQIPSVLGGRYDAADQIDLFPTWWHCLIFDNLLRGRPWGTTVTSEDCCVVLHQHQVSVGPHPERAVVAFLRHLAAHGFLRLDRYRHSPHGPVFTVLAEIGGYPRFMPGVAELSGAVTTDGARGSRHNGTDRWVSRHDPGGPGPWSHCRTCGLRLDPILHKVGYHFGCAPPEPPDPATEPIPEQDTLF